LLADPPASAAGTDLVLRGADGMPVRRDIETILIIGSGPIVIGQACEFDYSGTQACKVLRKLGYKVVLVNSNPATIMTDPQFSDRTYIEPLDVATVASIIERERPDALLPTLGGQTALNLAVQLHEEGVLERCGVELIGANVAAIKTAESRDAFKSAMVEIGLDVPRSEIAVDVKEAVAAAESLGYPVVLRPSFILGGGGSSVVHSREQLEAATKAAFHQSPTGQVLVEESVLGWKEFELEVMRDLADNVVIICSIENFDPMGVHTGDSITVAPAQTLSDREYQQMRDAAMAVIRRIGVETGGSNIQFAVHPETGRMVVIEMNPRVSRSSALASKATGFPIAKMAAQLAVGLTLDEIANDITEKTPASFEPTIDYVVVKVPKWAYEKFPGVDDTLGTQMMSVGEVMAIGRTFPEALQKALRSLEIGAAGLGLDKIEDSLSILDDASLLEAISRPTAERVFQIGELLRRGAAVTEINRRTGIDTWFLSEMRKIYEARRDATSLQPADQKSLPPRHTMRELKRLGFSDVQIARLSGTSEAEVRDARSQMGLRTTYKTVDTCAAEFEASTPYHYGTYEDESEVVRSDRDRVVILGAGPNRIGQGIEFDYCCVHAVFALQQAGYETIMINCNPETVSTDYDTADKLYFEPLTLEDVLSVIEAEDPMGVIVQLGGQTPLKLAQALQQAGVPILGTSPDAIDVAEDRRLFGELCSKLGVLQPPNATVTSVEEAVEAAADIGYPVLVRPSYVLGGRAMEIVYREEDLVAYVEQAVKASRRIEGSDPDEERPVLIDRFLEDAIEVDVDALCDGDDVLVAGVMEHIEEAGVHSGDSACVLPPKTLSPLVLDTIEEHVVELAKALEVKGLINVQLAVKDGEVYVLEANPRASRTVPFVSKATGIPIAGLAALVMVGKSLAELRREGRLLDPAVGHVAVKEAVLPFERFASSDALLGPEMRSTGETMGIGQSFGIAFAKAEAGASSSLPIGGAVFISVADRDKDSIVPVGRRFARLGFEIFATAGTANLLTSSGIPARTVAKLGEGGLTGLDLIEEGRVGLVINTPQGRGPRADGYYLRRAALEHRIPCITTIAGAEAAASGIAALQKGRPGVRCLQEYHS
jgi:carbamoyl-phosphate synthase large subunit